MQTDRRARSGLERIFLVLSLSRSLTFPIHLSLYRAPLPSLPPSLLDSPPSASAPLSPCSLRGDVNPYHSIEHLAAIESKSTKKRLFVSKLNVSKTLLSPSAKIRRDPNAQDMAVAEEVTDIILFQVERKVSNEAL